MMLGMVHFVYNFRINDPQTYARLAAWFGPPLHFIFNPFVYMYSLYRWLVDCLGRGDTTAVFRVCGRTETPPAQQVVEGREQDNQAVGVGETRPAQQVLVVVAPKDNQTAVGKIEESKDSPPKETTRLLSSATHHVNTHG